MKKFYITTPIYYLNGKPHIGHSYTTILADIISRYHRSTGKEVFFLTGSDEHGQKIQKSAEAKGISPKEFTDQMTVIFQDLCKTLGATNNDFIRTTDERHKITVHEIFNRLEANGDIYKGTYSGSYCIPCESFWSESQLLEGGLCPDCKRPVEEVSEESYFFKLSEYAPKIKAYIENNPDFCQPESKRKEILARLNDDIHDLSISRTTFEWGIPLPNDPKHVVYVWFDALINYLSGIGYFEDGSDRKDFWPANLHLIGKEIAWFHVVIWPSILMAADIELPKKVFSHGWLTIDGQKMGKSLGNAIDPFTICEKFGTDAMRYYLASQINMGNDGDYSEEKLMTKYNADLANCIGNLLNRTVSMIQKYFKEGFTKTEIKDTECKNLLDLCSTFDQEKEATYLDLQLHKIAEKIKHIGDEANQLIVVKEPWALAKKEETALLHEVMYTLYLALRKIALNLYPFIPIKAQEMWEVLGFESKIEDFTSSELDASFAEEPLPAVSKKIVFPRLEE